MSDKNTPAPSATRTRPDTHAHIPVPVYAALAASGMTDDAILVHMPAPKRKGSAGELTLRVSQKGALSVYGLGQWPVTLYQEQWTRLLKDNARIVAFIEANKATLKAKGDPEREVPAADAAKG